MSSESSVQEKVPTMRENADAISSALVEAHSIVDSLTSGAQTASENTKPTDSIVGQLELALQNNRDLTANLLQRLYALKNRF